jgi:hypothetical protein
MKSWLSFNSFIIIWQFLNVTLPLFSNFFFFFSLKCQSIWSPMQITTLGQSIDNKSNFKLWIHWIWKGTSIYTQRNKTRENTSYLVQLKPRNSDKTHKQLSRHSTISKCMAGNATLIKAQHIREIKQWNVPTCWERVSLYSFSILFCWLKTWYKRHFYLPWIYSRFSVYCY